ncbi:hypothetical protein BH10BAC5_BH10BAC5_16890 [soil metagenome]
MKKILFLLLLMILFLSGCKKDTANVIPVKSDKDKFLHNIYKQDFLIKYELEKYLFDSQASNNYDSFFSLNLNENIVYVSFEKYDRYHNFFFVYFKSLKDSVGSVKEIPTKLKIEDVVTGLTLPRLNDAMDGMKSDIDEKFDDLNSR